MSHTNGANPSKYPTAEFRQPGAILFLAYRSLMDPKHLLHQLMVGPATAHEERLRFLHPFAPAARKLLNDLSKLSFRTALWTDYKWGVKYSEGQPELRLFVPRPSVRPLGVSLDKTQLP